jgi:hypothetical protein
MVMTALARVAARLTALAPVTRLLVAARMTPAARVTAAQPGVTPAVLARVRVMVVRAGTRARFPVIGVIGVIRVIGAAVVTVVPGARLAAREVAGGRRAWPVTTRRLVTGRAAGLPGPAGAPPPSPPGQITPDRPATPAPGTRPRTQPQTRPQTRPGQTRPVLGRPVPPRLAPACLVPVCLVLIRAVPVTVIRARLALARPAVTVHSVLACVAPVPGRLAESWPERRTACRR